ncbi:hypothetical protein CSHISOI_09364 [Colletotrichum shisoi]|uniref:Uncharacterized protein n=1 Tax=Colletotrichum shisoi TaxID=2078593 RepID=A0A5Q4BH06_9PEZI|nr:hypothetical protein CSHISOI_09364 [Colletotrichum shisoi]
MSQSSEFCQHTLSPSLSLRISLVHGCSVPPSQLLLQHLFKHLLKRQKM